MIEGRYKLMIIDTSADKLIEEIYCDAVIAGYARRFDGDSCMCGSTTLGCGDISVDGNAIDAAEKAASRAEEKIVESVLKNMRGDAQSLITETEGEE